ncbi:FAD-binding oxidoreductase [Bacillus obstructivus]|uniref:FAD-binding oxidoreductase n=1 Tax=Heyndrickxia oleronia TaxID=38875 RepID=UPI000903D96E|nr:FAD-binding oxidoreductase [Bacillus obstructivus]
MKRKHIFLIIVVYGIILGASIYSYKNRISHPVAEDKGHLLPISMKSIQSAHGDKEIQKIVKKAIKTNDKLSIAGMSHSQGGQTLYPNAIMIDMKQYNKIINLDKKNKTITVQSGATWDDIQRYINPFGLSIKVMQSQNIFTVGGSLSVNVHGRDIRNDALIDTIQSFHLLNPKGEIVNVSRTENAELFPYVIGGYGLFGVILDVTIQLTDDELYVTKTKSLNYQNYSTYFEEKVKNNEKVKMHLARISVAPKTFLREMYVTNYEIASNQEEMNDYSKLKRDNIVAVPKALLGMSRYSNWGKDAFWELQKKYMKTINNKLETRNNVMRSEIAFMDYDSGTRTEVLQEYFVPVGEFASYIDDLRAVLNKEKDFNLLNITIRYVSKNDHAVMSYSKDNMFALVLLINQGRSKQDIKSTEKVVQKMIDVTLAHQGSYYLPYYSYPTKEQLYQAYPHAAEFFDKKRKYDPEERFVNLFYKEYGK